MSKPHPLDKILKRFEDAVAEIGDLESARPKLEAEGKKLRAELGYRIERFFVLAGEVPEAGDVSPDESTKIARLKLINEKLGLLPSVLEKLVSSARQIREALGEAVLVEQTRLCDLVKAELNKTELDLKARVIAQFGDTPAAHRGFKALLSETLPARLDLALRYISGHPDQGARQLISIRNQLEAVETAAQATPVAK